MEGENSKYFSGYEYNGYGEEFDEVESGSGDIEEELNYIKGVVVTVKVKGADDFTKTENNEKVNFQRPEEFVSHIPKHTIDSGKKSMKIQGKDGDLFDTHIRSEQVPQDLVFIAS